ncbi:MAG: hypothetical protein KJ706_09705 [Candidatus Omnitrophica bacterium]|nr:hypothetical protein [Candidatus Omnitrophota bacterium]MBU4590419.1 hypothetical protein [Candidatus Omnitrophota bacterium]
MKRKKDKKAFSFRPDIEYIKRTMNMSARFKLEWLEEFNIFINKALSKRKKGIWEKFRRGEI